MLTEDENIVEVELNLNTGWPDPVAFALRVELPERTLLSAAESALRHEVGSAAMDPILTTGRAVLAEKCRFVPGLSRPLSDRYGVDQRQH